MDDDTARLALQNAQTIYKSEYTQGMTTAVAGGIAVAVGLFLLKNTWVVVIGVLVLAYGAARISRAGGVQNHAEQAYAASMNKV